MSKLDAVLPPPAQLAHPLTGEVIERDDLYGMLSALAETDEWLDNWHREHRSLYNARDALRAREGELVPVALPPRRNQTEKQAKLERCPHCRTRLPRRIIKDIEEEE